MASDTETTDENIAYWRRIALSAEPYDEDSDEMNTFDGEWTPEQQKRRQATMARFFLRKMGVPINE